ncbi:MAG: glutamate-5-semialdehyde dehydrogenase [Firmicutes bacterium]|nr:glutamate-5-semialdehyde dehydrogenase [[Eubacterium] siraeum]MCM1486995.1 glutamate-5-semialdehyde dehydrogenase [Bacillota bacterium]
MTYTEELGLKAKKAEASIRGISQQKKNQALTAIAKALTDNAEKITAANRLDLENAVQNNMSAAMQDRLKLDEKRIGGMAEGVLKIVSLPDPVGRVLGGRELPNGLQIVKKSVPLGVIGIIFESRPNVTVDAAALCLKSGNVSVLRGGSDAINSNKCLVSIMQSALEECGICRDAVSLVEDTSRETVGELMRLNRYIDVLIPRGGHGLIQNVVNNSTIPVIQTGEGNCSVYVDASADTDMAVNIADNGKTQRPSVCNAIENILVHKDIAAEFLPALQKRWQGRVRILGDKRTARLIKTDGEASETEYATEFLDYVIAVKIVDGIDEAIDFINTYGTKHSECIVTSDYQNGLKFQQNVDAAAVYVNASTRFTDGGEFGLGAEIGISTQKLHARGPMGLEEMTTYKYLISGCGQIRS